MSSWLLKTDDDEYVEWSTNEDAPTSPFVDRDEAVARWGDQRVKWADTDLNSCRARLGERFELRNGKAVAVGGGRLAFRFETYAEVHEFISNEGHRPSIDELRAR